jgi:hypothetical protein
LECRKDGVWDDSSIDNADGEKLVVEPSEGACEGAKSSLFLGVGKAVCDGVGRALMASKAEGPTEGETLLLSIGTLDAPSIGILLGIRDGRDVLATLSLSLEGFGDFSLVGAVDGIPLGKTAPPLLGASVGATGTPRTGQGLGNSVESTSSVGKFVGAIVRLLSKFEAGTETVHLWVRARLSWLDRH